MFETSNKHKRGSGHTNLYKRDGEQECVLNGVFDNTTTMKRERYCNNELTSSLPCTDKMRNNKFFPWGCFDDVPK